MEKSCGYSVEEAICATDTTRVLGGWKRPLRNACGREVSHTLSLISGTRLLCITCFITPTEEALRLRGSPAIDKVRAIFAPDVQCTGMFALCAKFSVAAVWSSFPPPAVALVLCCALWTGAHTLSLRVTPHALSSALLTLGIGWAS